MPLSFPPAPGSLRQRSADILVRLLRDVITIILLAHAIPAFSAPQSVAITRGPVDKPRIALVFTGHEFAEGADTILNQLSNHQAKASFFLTGSFLTNRGFRPVVARIIYDRHYLGPHSNEHLLYCTWDKEKTTLVKRDQFRADLRANLALIEDRGVARAKVKYFLPPFEHYNPDILRWTSELFLQLINFTPGTRSTADYTGEADKNFVSSQAIFDSILSAEQGDPHGLNGYFLLLHLGSGPARQDKFHVRFGELLGELKAKGYSFVTVDQMLGGQ